MKLQQLRYFEATCRFNNISRAAESLHVSQPSVSMAIRDLEREFGVALISRRYQGFVLTEEGRVFQEMASSLLRHADHVSEQMRSLGRRRRPIRLGVPPMIATVMLPTLYQELEVHYPDIRLSTEELGTKSLIRDLLEKSLDLAFLTHDAPLPNALTSIPIVSMEGVWCAAPEHPLAGCPSISIEQLEGAPLVAFQDSFFLQESIVRRFEEAGIQPNVLHTTGQVSTVQSLIRSGTATGFLLRPMAATMPELSIVPLDPPVVVQVSLAWNGNEAPFRDMRKFIALCRQELFSSCFTNSSES